MIELQCYLRKDVPAHLAAQVRSYTRVQWPGLNRSTELWPVGAGDARHFVLVDGELLVAHASVRVREVAHGGVAWRVAGVSAVFCYPDYRGRGLGERVAREATGYIVRETGADCAMLFCGERVASMYKRIGWEHVAGARVTYGTPATLKTDNLIMMMFLSDRGRGEGRRVFGSEVVHVGESTW